MPAPLQAGTFLIASPNLDNLSGREPGDSNFNRTVVLLLQHMEEEGTLGVIVNRPLGEKIKLYSSEALSDGLAAMEEFPIEPASMFYQGGPVSRDQLVVLHQLGDMVKGSMEICDGIYAGGDLDTLRTHAAMFNADKPVLRFFLGYSGWETGQLEQEIERDSWILSPGSVDLTFSTEPDRVWQRALYTLGDKYQSMSVIPENLILN